MVRTRGLGELLGYEDVFSDPEVNEIANELFREEIRRVVKDQHKAEKLVPRNFGVGCKRQVLDRDYYTTFNRENVVVVDLQEEPLERINARGVATTAAQYDLDVLVYATGFDAVTGALLKADITGRDGQPLREAWQDAPANYLGVQVRGFPNLFTVTGPGSPSALANMIVHIEQHIDWIGDCIDYVRQSGKQTIEPTKQSMVDWMVEVSDAAKGTMYVSPGCHSWYLGHNVPGKPGVFLPYIGGFRKYIERCDWEAENGYPSFELR